MRTFKEFGQTDLALLNEFVVEVELRAMSRFNKLPGTVNCSQVNVEHAGSAHHVKLTCGNAIGRKVGTFLIGIT